MPSIRAWTVGLLAGWLSGCDSLDLPGPTPQPTPSAVVKPSARLPDSNLVRTGEVFTGKMSWYSVKTNGGTKTASGEKLSDQGDTAAHPSLPFGTLVEVTNLRNESTAVLRINDRGPYAHGRVLDVSIGAARRLGFEKHGVVSCHVEVLREDEETETEAEMEVASAEMAGAEPAAEAGGASEAEGGE